MPDPKSPLDGLWEVEEFHWAVADGVDELSGSKRWQKLAIGPRPHFGWVQRVNGNRLGSTMRIDTADKKLFLLFLEESEFSYDTPTPTELQLEGRYEGRALSARLRLVDKTCSYSIVAASIGSAKRRFAAS